MLYIRQKSSFYNDWRPSILGYRKIITNTYLFCKAILIIFIITFSTSTSLGAEDLGMTQVVGQDVQKTIDAIEAGERSYFTLSPEELNDLEEVVFSAGRGGDTLNRMFLWKQDVRLAIGGMQLTRNLRTDIDTILKFSFGILARYTKVNQVSSGANFVIIFSDDIISDAMTTYREAFLSMIPGRSVSYFEKYVGAHRSQSSKCFSYSAFSVIPAQRVGSIIFIDSSVNRKHLLQCLSRELLRSLGLPGVSEMDGSILRRSSDKWLLGPTDVRYLSLIYSNLQWSGMTREEFSEAAKSAVER